jgi:hypothetical protein
VADSLIPLFYGACVIAALVLAVISRRVPLIKLGLILLAAWGACNVVVITHGHASAPLLIPTIDAILALLTAGVAAIDHDKTAGAVFAIFVGVQIVHVAAFETHTQGTYSYFLTLNLLFLAQVLVVGGWSAWVVVADYLAEPPRLDSRGSGGWLRHGPRARRG